MEFDGAKLIKLEVMLPHSTSLWWNEFAKKKRKRKYFVGEFGFTWVIYIALALIFYYNPYNWSLSWNEFFCKKPVDRKGQSQGFFKVVCVYQDLKMGRHKLIQIVWKICLSCGIRFCILRYFLFSPKGIMYPVHPLIT